MSGKDLAVAVVLIVGFSTFVTAHVWLAARLLRLGKPRWRGIVAFFVPPLAPIWGVRRGLRRGAALWVGSLLVYVIALLVANFA